MHFDRRCGNTNNNSQERIGTNCAPTDERRIKGAREQGLGQQCGNGIAGPVVEVHRCDFAEDGHHDDGDIESLDGDETEEPAPNRWRQRQPGIATTRARNVMCEKP